MDACQVSGRRKLKSRKYVRLTGGATVDADLRAGALRGLHLRARRLRRVAINGQIQSSVEDIDTGLAGVVAFGAVTQVLTVPDLEYSMPQRGQKSQGQESSNAAALT